MQRELNNREKMALWQVFTPLLQCCDTLTDDELKTLYEMGEDLGLDCAAEISRIKGNAANKNPYEHLSEYNNMKVVK